MENLDIVKKIYKVLNNKLAEDIKVYFVREISSLADYFIVCSAKSQRQVISLAENVEYELSKDDVSPKSIEGISSANWVLMDYYDVIVHIFTEENREFYSLDRLWQDADILEDEDLK